MFGGLPSDPSLNPKTVFAKLLKRWNLPESVRCTPSDPNERRKAASFSGIVGGMVPMHERVSTTQNLPKSADPTRFVLRTFRKWNVASRSFPEYPSAPTFVE
jgi:hypothetical protein